MKASPGYEESKQSEEDRPQGLVDVLRGSADSMTR